MKLFKHFFILLFLTYLSLNAKELEKVSLQLSWLDQFQFAGYYMAIEKGYYKELNLDVELKPFSNNVNVLNDVLDKKTTYGIGRSSLIINQSNGAKIKLISSIFQSSPLVLIAMKDKNIKTVKDFKNKRIMNTLDTKASASLIAMITHENVDIHSLQMLKHTFNIDDLINNKTDLMASYISNEPFLLEQRNLKYRIFNPTEHGFDFYSDILFTSDVEANNHKQRTKNFKSASTKGWEYAFSHIDETVELILKKYNSQKKSKEALLYEAKELKKLAYFDTTKLGSIDIAKLQRIYDVYNLMGLLEKKVRKININNFIFKDIKKVSFDLTDREKKYIQNNNIINICVLPDSMPYSKIDVGKYVGMGADYLDLVSKKVGFTFNLVHTDSWKESLENAKNRKCDILPIAAKTKSRIEYLNFTNSIFEAPIVIVTKKSEIFISDISKISDKSLGVVKGYSIKDYLQQRYPNINIVEVSSNKEGLKKVSNGEIYAMVGDLASLAYSIQRSNENNLKISGSVGDGIEVGIGVRSDDVTLLNILNKVIKNIDEKEKQSVFNKWISVSYIKKTDYILLIYSVSFLLILILVGIYRHRELKTHNKDLKLIQIKLSNLNETLETRIKEELQKNKEKDKQVLQHTRLAQMGEMISMIAHQWRQPLGAIASTAIDMKLQIELETFNLNSEEEQKLCHAYFTNRLNSIDSYIKGLTSTIDDFRNFYKPNKESSISSISIPLKTALKIIKQNIQLNNISISENYNSIKEIEMFPNELVQVFLNILKNAQDNLIDKKIKDAYMSIFTKDIENGILIEICDNGGGVDNDIIDKIFDPYFSTKDEKNGTGLGLYMSKMIIDEHHKAKLRVSNYNSLEGCSVGACFSIELKDVFDE